MVTISTTRGAIEGVERPGVVSFLAIAYAAPPVGRLRWRAPEPPDAWSGTYRATAHPTRSHQAPFPADLAPPGGIPGAMGEDMLYLNVHTPALGGQPRPVMVYIHGGGYTLGSANDFDPAPYAARTGLVVVAVNYRLGIFGFLDLSRFGCEYRGSANLGFQDQIAALRWVKANIADFGGDPDNITICGCSAGGGSVIALMSAPAARGLYRRGVAMSPLEIAPAPPDVIGACSAALGVSPEALFAQLSAMTGGELYEFQARMRLAGGACVDGDVIVAGMQDGVRAGVNVTPLLVGTTLTEGEMLTAGLIGAAGRSEAAFQALESGMLDRIAAGDVSAYLALLNELTQGLAPEARLNRVWYDSFRAHAVRTADALARVEAPAWLYTFAPPTEHPYGPTHGADVPFVFNSLDPARDGEMRVYYRNEPRTRALARLWSRAFARFVECGDPNGADFPVWPSYDPSLRACLVLKDKPEVVFDFEGARLRAAYGMT